MSLSIWVSRGGKLNSTTAVLCPEPYHWGSCWHCQPECRSFSPTPVGQTLGSQSEFLACSFLDWFLRDLFFHFFFFFGTQELNSFNYLDLYRLADLFNLTLLEKAVIDFLVKHLSELLKSRPEDILTLPYCLLQEVLKSDRLTSLSEEQIWQVRALCMGPLLAWRHSMIKS